MPRKVFVAGEILTAADVNTNLMDQAVMVFDDATARTTAIPTPVEGMVTYLKDANQVQAFTGSAFTAVGGILQVVSTVKTDTFTTASATFVDVTDLTVSITPSSASSKILVLVQLKYSQNDLNEQFWSLLVRDSTPINIGDVAGSRRQAMSQNLFNFANTRFHVQDVNGVFLDSPATTSSTTYKMQIAVSDGTGFINRSGVDSNSTATARLASTITLMEVAG